MTFSASAANAAYEAFGLDGPEGYGLDYASARDATPRWFGVSFGNGNDGVSRSFPSYYVRTNDPYHLAACAMLANFNNATAEDKARIIDATEVDGEADYGVNATIYNPEDIEPEDRSFGECDLCDNPDKCKDQMMCDLGEMPAEDEESELWCNVNGAWLICEVFPVDEMPGCMLITDSVDGRTVEHVQYNPYGPPAYCTLADAFNAEDLRLTAD